MDSASSGDSAAGAESGAVDAQSDVGNAPDASADAKTCASSFPVPNMPDGRFALSAVRGVDGRIYAISGVDSGGLTSEVDAYDPCTNGWTAVAPIPTPRNAAVAAVGSDGRIYVMGGQSSSPIATVEAYDVTTNMWSAVAPMPTARANLGAATGSDGRIYAVGGFPGGSTQTNVVEAYDATTNQWSTVAAMSTARFAPVVVADANGIVYAIGGGTYSCAVYASVEAYDPSTNQWTGRASLPSAVYEHSAALGPDGRIYSFGGEVGSGCQTGAETNLFIYDPSANSWTSGMGMTTAVRSAASASGTGPGALVYVFGGTSGGSSVLATAQAYDPVANVWR